MVAPRRSGRSRFTLFLLMLLSITLLTLDARDFGPVERLKDGISAVVSPIRSFGDTVFGPVGDFWRGLSENDDLRRENEALRSRLETLQGETIENKGAAEELAALEDQLGLEVREVYETTVAEVLAASISNFDEFVLEINRGSVDGVRDGMPVVTVGGLVGRVEDTGRRTARVRLITDPSVSVGVQVVGTEEVGIITGQGAGQPLLVSKGSIRVDAEVAVGDVIVTAGSDRSLYPPNIAVGTVVEIEVDEGTLEKRLLVEPSASLERLRFVTVVLFDPDADAAVPGDGASAAQATPGEDG